MYLKSDNICVRNAAPSDCPQLAAWWNDGAVMAHAGFPNGIGVTPDEIRRHIENDGSYKKRLFIIEYCGRPIGEMNYSDKGDQTAEIGIKICDPNCQDAGLGRIILSVFIKELFSRGFRRIILDTNLNNHRARHVYELLGFRKIRINIDSWTNQIGELQSSVDYELTPEYFRDYSALPETGL